MAQESMLDRYNNSNLKEKTANVQAVDFFDNTFGKGFRPNLNQGDKSAYKDAAIQSRTADTSTKYTDTVRT